MEMDSDTRKPYGKKNEHLNHIRIRVHTFLKLGHVRKYHEK